MPEPPRQRPVPTTRRPSLPAGGSAPDRIVVAVDGSAASVRALLWALDHAVATGASVEALTAWPLHGAVFVREVAGHFCEPRWRAREVQADAVARALAEVRETPPYDLRVVNADLVDALVRASARAVIVVVGSDRPQSDRADRRGLSERLRKAIPDQLVVVGKDGPEGHRLATTSAPGRAQQPPAR